MVNAFILRNRCVSFSSLSLAFFLAVASTLFANAQAIDPTAGTSQTKQPSSVPAKTAPAAKAKAPVPAQPAALDPRFNQHAHGQFDVKITPLPLYDKSAPPTLGRRALERNIHGDFEGTSRGEMLTANTKVNGTEAYCAIEYISGSLKGRKGSFILQHKGLIVNGKIDMVLSVVPDSGTGDLTGLEGTLNIDVAGGKHFYDFAYMLPKVKAKVPDAKK